MKALLLVAGMWVLSSAVAAAQDPAALSPDAPSRVERGNPVTYDVELRAVVTAPYKTQVLRVWMPVPPDDAGQEVLGERTFGTWPMQVAAQVAAEPLYGNRFAFFEFRNPKGAQMIAHRFRIRVWELRWNLDPAAVARVGEWPQSFAPYLRAERQSVVLSDAVRDTARRIVPEPGAPLDDIGRLIAWIDDNLRYDGLRSSMIGSSLWALEQRTGNCADYHGLCAAFSRSLSYPARVVYGIQAFPKESPSHCKAELFLPPYGWVSFDLSETWKMRRQIEKDASLDAARRAELLEAARRRLVIGYRDNTWFAQTRGTEYDLAPPASRPVALVRTLWAEADGVPLPEPDPGDPARREFAWMTLHRYEADRAVTYPFTDLATLDAFTEPR